MNTKSNNKLVSLLVNDDFINYVLNPNLVLNEMWDEFFEEHPDVKEIAEEARSILLGNKLEIIPSAGLAHEMELNILTQCHIA